MSKHITEEQRYAISMMLQIRMSKKAIAEAIGVDKSTVYREIKRNCDARSGSYSMELAQRKADRRKQQKHRKEVLTPAMRKRIIKLLKKGFSPEQIVGRSRLEGIAMVSHETIYRWIWEDKRRGGKLHKYLRRQGRRYAKRGSKNAGRGFIPGRVDIDDRAVPQSVIFSAILHLVNQEIRLDERCTYQQDRSKDLRKLSARSEQLRHDLAGEDKEPGHTCPERRIYIRPCGPFERTFRIRTGTSDYKEYPRVPHGVARYSVFSN